MTPSHYKKYCLIPLLFAVTTAAAQVAERFNFFYFNPDSTQNNLRQLKSDMDVALRESNVQANFQPFARLADLDQQIRKSRPALIYVPYWYFKYHGARLGLRPLLYSERDNSTVYRKVLIVSRHSTLRPGTGKTTTLAMTTMGPEGRTLLNELLLSRHNYDIQLFNVIEVPRDIDAIFAVALGQVDSALVSPGSLRLLEQRNPRLTESVSVVAGSEPIRLPVLCYLQNRLPEAAIQTLRKQLQDTARKASVAILGILGIDAWSTEP